MINWRRVTKIASIWFFMLCAFMGGKNAFAWTVTFQYQTDARDACIAFNHNKTCDHIQSPLGPNTQGYYHSDDRSPSNNYAYRHAGSPPTNPDPSTCTATSLAGKTVEDDQVNIHGGSHTYTTPDGCQYQQSSSEVECYPDHTGQLWCIIDVTATGTTVEPPETCDNVTCLIDPNDAPAPATATCPTTAAQQATIDQIVNGYAGTVLSCQSEDVLVAYWNTNLDCQRHVYVSPNGNWFETSPAGSVCNGTGSSSGDLSDPATNPDADGDGSQSGGAPGTGGTTGGDTPWGDGGSNSSPGNTDGVILGDVNTIHNGGTNPNATNEATVDCDDTTGDCIVNFGDPNDTIPTGKVGQTFSNPQSLATDITDMFNDYDSERDNAFDPLLQAPYLDSVEFDDLNVFPSQQGCDSNAFGVDYHGEQFEPLTEYCPIHDEYVRPALAWFIAICTGIFLINAFNRASRTI